MKKSLINFSKATKEERSAFFTEMAIESLTAAAKARKKGLKNTSSTGSKKRSPAR